MTLRNVEAVPELCALNFMENGALWLEKGPRVKALYQRLILYIIKSDNHVAIPAAKFRRKGMVASRMRQGQWRAAISGQPFVAPGDDGKRKGV